MKKEIAAVLAIVLTISLVGCGSGKDSGTTSSKATVATESNAQVKSDAVSKAESKAESKASDGKLGDFNVVISDARMGKDYNGKPVAFVKFHFTNNSDKATSFAQELVVEAYQNGAQVEIAIPGEDSKYNADNYMKKIKKGVSLDIEYPVALSDTKSSLEVNVKPMMSLDDTKVTKTFDISKLN